MRTLNIVHTESSPGWGGQETRILLEASVLQKQGHHVLIVGQPEGLLKKEAEQAGIPFQAVRMRASWDPLALIQMLRLIRKYRPDVIHTHSSKDSWLAGLAGRALAVPVVRTRHVSIPVKGHWLNWVYRLPHRIMATAERIRQMLIEDGGCSPSRVCVLPTGVDFSKFHENVRRETFRQEFSLEEDTPAVGIIAQLRKSKGHDHLLAAARILKEKGARAHFFIVGDGEWRDIFRAEAERLGLSDGTVIFTGYRRDVPQIMAGLDLLVIASTRTEGIPQVALQAMAMGLPIIGTDIGGVPEVLGPSGAGKIIPSGDPNALAEGIEELLADPALRARMGASGKIYAREHHSLGKMLAETVHIYEEVMAVCAR